MSGWLLLPISSFLLQKKSGPIAACGRPEPANRQQDKGNTNIRQQLPAHAPTAADEYRRYAACCI
jgi:hypothetical protein